MIKTFVITGSLRRFDDSVSFAGLGLFHGAGKLPKGFQVIGLARDPWNTETFRQHLGETMARAAPGTSAALRDAILRISEYHQVDVTNHVRWAGACMRSRSRWSFISHSRRGRH